MTATAALRAFVYRYRFLVFSTIVLTLAALVYAAGMDPQMTPFALVLLPTLAALVTAAVSGRGELGELGRRLTRWRLHPRLYVIAIGIPILANLLIVALAVATGMPASDAFSGLTATALVVPLVVLAPAILEEIGWRGFGLPALGRYPLIVGALAVGIPFTLIHLPLHQAGQLYDGLAMWATILSTMSLAVILAWGFAAGGGSVVIASLMHATANGAVPLTWGVDPVLAWELRAVSYAVMAVVVVVFAWHRFMSPLDVSSAEEEAVLVSATS